MHSRQEAAPVSENITASSPSTVDWVKVIVTNEVSVPGLHIDEMPKKKKKKKMEANTLNLIYL